MPILPLLAESALFRTGHPTGSSRSSTLEVDVSLDKCWIFSEDSRSSRQAAGDLKSVELHLGRRGLRSFFSHPKKNPQPPPFPQKRPREDPALERKDGSYCHFFFFRLYRRDLEEERTFPEQPRIPPWLGEMKRLSRLLSTDASSPPRRSTPFR